MDKIVLIGKIVSFHGVKGEVKIRSNFKKKKFIFKKDNCLIIDNKNYVIESYRVHKDYDLIKFNDYNNLNEVTFLKDKKVYADLENIHDEQFLTYDLITYKVFSENKMYGVVFEVVNYGSCDILVVEGKDKNYHVSFDKNSIINIDHDNKKIIVVEGMIL